MWFDMRRRDYERSLKKGKPGDIDKISSTE